MQLTTLRIKDLRCIESAEIEASPHANFIVGGNGAGKTSLLEAIYLLGHGRTFRESRGLDLVRRGAAGFEVRGLGIRGRNRATLLSAQWRDGEMQLHCGEVRDARRLDLARTLVVQVLDQGMHRLIEQGPRFRRRFLDWGTFHVEPSFLPAWQRYARALGQRNRAIRSKQVDAVVVAWDRELAASGQLVDAARRAHVAMLAEYLPDYASTLMNGVELRLEYAPGWARGETLEKALVRGFSIDRSRGVTLSGPHRADLSVGFEGSLARGRVSRGQQKLLGAALCLAQNAAIKKNCGFVPILLVDDFGAELDWSSRRSLMEQITALGGQTFVTMLEVDAVDCPAFQTRMFHVERGRVRAGG